MSIKKQTAKIKEKRPHSVAAKRKPAAEAPESSRLMDARGGKDRRGGDRREKEAAVAVERRLSERRVKVSRRRQIDPTTCERDYSVDEVEFMGALDDYKRRNGRMFPTCSEVLEVIRSLGYEKRIEAPASDTPSEPVALAAIASAPSFSAVLPLAAEQAV